MHTRCCEKCSYVVHCFGTVLNSTGLIEAIIDMWSTLDIAPNVPRWYEDQINNSHCVVVLASNKMSLRCQNAVEEGDDRKYSWIPLHLAPKAVQEAESKNYQVQVIAMVQYFQLVFSRLV